jgi:hypothetical protein
MDTDKAARPVISSTSVVIGLLGLWHVVTPWVRGDPVRLPTYHR